MPLLAATGTDTGRVRSLNEDNVFAYVRPAEKGVPRGLYIVADGMGGHAAGEVASELAVETISNMLMPFLERDDQVPAPDTNLLSDSDEVTEATEAFDRPSSILLQIAIQKANDVIRKYGQDHPEEAGNLGTTVTCALVVDDKVFIANVGDSRTYHKFKGKLIRITEDHSYVWHLVQLGQLEEEQIYSHHQRSLITRALGNEVSVDIDVWERPFLPNDALLLCSDGLWEMIQDDGEFAIALKTCEDINVIVNELIDMANDRGGEDNVSAVVGFYAE